jgi:hypothetical protein
MAAVNESDSSRRFGLNVGENVLADDGKSFLGPHAR